MKIDFHCHCDMADPDKIRKFVRAYEKRNVIACIVGGPLYGGHDMVPNEEVIKICAQYPGRIYPLAKINLWDQAPDPSEWWGTYFFIKTLLIPSVVAFISTFWFGIGGAIDLFRLFRDLLSSLREVEPAAQISG